MLFLVQQDGNCSSSSVPTARSPATGASSAPRSSMAHWTRASCSDTLTAALCANLLPACVHRSSYSFTAPDAADRREAC